MKKILLLTFVLFPIITNAQVSSKDFENNDSTEYILTPINVTDTAKVEAIANEYRIKWQKRLDDLNKEKQVINEIRQYSDKKLPDELIPVYTKYVNNFKDLYETNRSKFVNTYTISKGQYKGYLDIEKTENQLNKGKVFKEMEQVLSLVITKDIDPLISRTQDSINMNVFDTYVYKVTNGSHVFPQKEILNRTKNPNYRGALFIQIRDKNYLLQDFDELDKRLQSQGWGWLEKEYGEEVRESYPIEYKYKKYKSHPEYKVQNNRWMYQIFNKEGELIYIPWLLRADYGDVRDLIDYLLLLEYRKDYESNKYNIKSEDKDVQYALKNQLGYSNEANPKAKRAFIKSSVADYESKKGTWQKRTKAHLEAEKQADTYIYEVIKTYNPTAMKFLEQLKKDHAQDYRYLFKIKRINDTAFVLHFVDYEMKPRCDVYVSYFTTEPNFYGHQVDKIVNF